VTCPLRIARGCNWQSRSRAWAWNLSASLSPERELSPPPIEVIFELEIYTRHLSTPQLPVLETYKHFFGIASFLLALESCIRHAIASSFYAVVEI
jgi:hypothetical protein